jgi:magnesium-transporting ATPase (P-type)
MSSVAGESRSCLGCGHEGESSVAQCPECGGRMFSADSVRRRGWFLIVLGLALTIFMGVLIIKQAIDVYHSGEPDARVKFTGGTGMLWLMFGVLALVFSFGVACTANGIWQVLYGKRNSNLASILLGLFFVLGVIVFVVLLFAPAQQQPERRIVQPPKSPARTTQ